MKKLQLIPVLLAITLITLAILACGGSASTPSAPTAPISPIVINDLTQIDMCAAIPVEDIEAVMGRKLSKAPEFFAYYDTTGSSGCQYEAQKDSDGEAHYGYVVLTPPAEYDNQPLYENIDVSGLGDAAYFNNGADARQLWVKVDDKVAFVIAFGDLSKEEGSKALAKLLLAAIH